jgi:glycerol-3-phosphate dehydrogenase (NAD(P)+)
MQYVGIYGAGKWGMAIDFIISQNVKSKISSRTPREIKNFVSIDELLKLEYIILSISAQYIKQFFKINKDKINKNHKFLIASKGIDVEENKFLNQICLEYLDEDNIAFLTGPSFAQEVIQKLPTTLCISSSNQKLRQVFVDIMQSNFVKMYQSSDVIGTEIAGAYKNPIAIASGIAEGLHLGNNAKASLISRGLIEMNRFGSSFGANIDTFLGISGAGDLFLSANSTMSRNYRLGMSIAQGNTLEQSLEEIQEVVEGVKSTFAIYAIAKENNIYVPIITQLREILNGGDVQVSIKKLLKTTI